MGGDVKKLVVPLSKVQILLLPKVQEDIFMIGFNAYLDRVISNETLCTIPIDCNTANLPYPLPMHMIQLSLFYLIKSTIIVRFSRNRIAYI